MEDQTARAASVSAGRKPPLTFEGARGPLLDHGTRPFLAGPSSPEPPSGPPPAGSGNSSGVPTLLLLLLLLSKGVCCPSARKRGARRER